MLTPDGEPVDVHCGRCRAALGPGSKVTLLHVDHYTRVFGPPPVGEIQGDGIVMLCLVCGVHYRATRAAGRVQ